ncbi:MAG: hypothetical protein Alis3KO_41080 [Aliiglaciecola sp.]
MNTRQYVNYFEEISHLSEEAQADLLEQARYEAFVKLKLSRMSASYFFGCLVFCFLPVFLSIIYFGLFSLVNLAAFAFSLIAPNFFIRRVNAEILHKGLKSVLSKNGV